MKKLLLFAAVLAVTQGLYSQCTTTNATDCVCKDGSDDCDLLPDITISWYALENYLQGPTEEPGIVYVTGSTPNIGHGAFTARGVDDDGYRWFICDDDTFSVYDPWADEVFYCPDGGTAQQIIFQRIYHKNNGDMTYWDHPMGPMTYHPQHGHNHFDNWGIFSLRLEDENESDPRNWPVVGTGSKLGFCLMDYFSCGNGSAYHHCKDDNTIYDQGTTMTNDDFPNYGLGGGSYNCSMVEQGISSGYTDVYSEYLDGMWVDIPDGTCNGDYWIVYEVDPYEMVIEENEENNWTAIPITLTEQNEIGDPEAHINSAQSPIICEGSEITLTANAGTEYLWSTGAQTQSIVVGAGTYSVEVTTYCGTATSTELTVFEIVKPDAPTTEGDLVCVGESASLSAVGSNITWYDDDGNAVGQGNDFDTPLLYETTMFYAAEVNYSPGTLESGAKPDNTGGGGYFSGDQHLKFNAMQSLIIKSVRVYADGAGDRTIEVRNSMGALVQSGVFFVDDGEQVVDLDFVIPAGSNYRITATGSAELYRNDSGVNYPYDTDGVFSVTTSSAGDDFYYFFYDWEVEAGAGFCNSDLIETVAEVEICDNLDDKYELSDNIRVYPNPSNGQFTLDVMIPGTSDIQLDILEMSGRIIYHQSFEDVYGKTQRVISLPDVSTGMYMAQITIGRKAYFQRIFIK
jgi:hypothetical protein